MRLSHLSWYKSRAQHMYKLAHKAYVKSKFLSLAPSGTSSSNSKSTKGTEIHWNPLNPLKNTCVTAKQSLYRVHANTYARFHINRNTQQPPLKRKLVPPQSGHLDVKALLHMSFVIIHTFVNGWPLNLAREVKVTSDVAVTVWYKLRSVKKLKNRTKIRFIQRDFQLVPLTRGCCC